ncbi:ribosomal-protein-alanine acetyltransferase [Agromyces flavus]|uniref:Ribosomal-protein-alanine N-acetyltransferase n=1 Tax=Agromyces flavus TaxID=589382 RepID=A0A1H1LU33_9MICO|nr:ribosomal protein S18-alanine N-acetyltransferase [Agromyces flavus]MCP2368611.1 ribosomal-protein-alanine acetyltransferase [Agromyces flavus]GGI48149.1 ribosomal-protein-alanine acetyltransferase [Agromyces flavus]SDR77269.1 ribosomal-protein-alanine N-acetyltransferase [Agromyces flavus]
MSLMLRRARPDDLAAIMVIERATFATDAWPEQAMRAELEGEHTYYLVVVDDASPDVAVAYAGLLAPRGSGQGDVQTIAVDAAARGRGLGRALMHSLIDEARRRGAAELFLEVRADNPVARGLYASLGFEEIGVRRGYYQPDGVDAIVMRLEVPPAVARPAASAHHLAAPAGDQT